MINFICKPCRAGADLPGKEGPVVVAKMNLHHKCVGGTHCDCQHRVGRKNVL